MPTSNALFSPQYAFLLLLWLLNGQVLRGQVIPKEGHLNVPQTPARTKEKITIYPGFSIPAGGSFEGEILPAAVTPPEPSTLTVSANVTLRVGESTPLTASAAPLVGNAISFDGVNDYVQVGNKPNLQLTGALTLEAWVYPTGTGSDPTAGGIILNKEGEYQMARFADGTLRWAFANASPGWQWINTGALLPLNTWSHVAVAHLPPSTSAPGRITTYLNGTVAHTSAASGAIGDAIAAQNDFRIGGRQAISQFFRGTIDEVRVWSLTLDGATVQDRYQRRLTTSAADATGLVGYWPLDEALDSHLVSDPGPSAGTLFNLPQRVRSTLPALSHPRQFTWSPAQGLSATTGPTVTFNHSTPGEYTYTVSSPNLYGALETAQVTVTVEGALPPLSPITENRNYIIENNVLKEGVMQEGELANLAADGMNQMVTYFDGLGRPIQSVGTQSGPSLKDVVVPMEYNAFGRQTKAYMPYLDADGQDGRYKENAVEKQAAVYRNSYGTVGDPFSYVQAHAATTFEASPLNRVLEKGAPGVEWQPLDNTGNSAGRTIKMLERTSTADDKVLRWQYNFELAQATSGAANFYAATELWVTQITDEHNNVTREFKDKKGQVVCKQVQESTGDQPLSFLTTYYVYDLLGNLRFVIPPQAAHALPADYTIRYGDAFTRQWLFAYKYDHRKRMTEKRVPGAEPVYLVYNEYDKLILSQDGNQRVAYNGRPAGQWTFTKYDALGRPVVSGLYQSGITSQDEMQREANKVTTYTESRSSEADAVEGYSNKAFPSSNLEVLTVSYYDSYAFLTTDEYNYQSPAAGFAGAPFGGTAGKATGSKVKVLGSDPAQWLLTVSYYDDRGRIIQVQSDNHTGGKDIASTRYDFAGRVLQTHTQHRNPNDTREKLIVLGRSTYDHAGRLKDTYQQINSQAYGKLFTGTEEHVSRQDYDMLNRVTGKSLGEDLQHVNFSYNLRGWLTHINSLNGVGEDNTQGSLFAMRLLYNGGDHPQFNGNIAAQVWKSASDRVERSYQYRYDALNRITAASYKATDRNGTLTNEQYSVSNISYDKNGNIRTMHRQGMTAGTPDRPAAFGEIDKLEYHYEKGNQLQWVKDEIANSGVAGDFQDRNDHTLAAQEYDYDPNGNLQEDKNKNIRSVQYNHLNLPVKVVMANGNTTNIIEYVYDASGLKLRKIVRDGIKGDSWQTDYVGGMVYERNVLQFVPTAEGRALPPEQTGEALFAYEYHYKDHLGNLRVAFRKPKAAQRYLATMEKNRAAEEEARFANLSDNMRDAGNCNGTAARLTPQQPIGPMRVMKVSKGDRLSAKVWAYYQQQSTNNDGSGFRLFVQALGGNPPAQAEGGAAFPTLAVGVALEPRPGELSQDVPKAYLQVLFYDQDHQYLEARTDYVSSTACHPLGVDPATGQAREIVVQQDGFVRVFVASESNAPVWFDDLEITHQPALLVQENHYDPWGMNLAGIEKQGLPDFEWQYIGREKQEELGLGWLDLQARMYDPQLGRFHVVDPLVELYQESWTPYHYSFNNPIRFSDPDGRWPDLGDVGEFFSGVGNAIGSNATTFQGPTREVSIIERESGGTAFTMGQAVGDAATVVGGVVEAVVGATVATGGTIGGIVTAPTGVGAVAGAAVASGGVVAGLHGLSTAKNGLNNLLGDNKGRVNADAGPTRKKGGALTEPNLPNKTIASKDGVSVEHYTRSGDHGPPHAHVKGGGSETRIGQNGKPLRNNPKPTAQQQSVIDEYKKDIRKAIKQIGRYVWFNNQ